MDASPRRRSWATVALTGTAVAAVSSVAVVLGSQDFGAAERGDPGRTDEQRAAQVYTALLRHHVRHDLPIAERDWNGVLYVPTTTRDDADDPMTPAFEPGDDEVPTAVQNRIEAALADVADVRWIKEPDDADIARLNPTDPCTPEPSAVLVWLQTLHDDGDRADVGYSSWGNCGVAEGGRYVLSFDAGRWAVSSATPRWIS